jgi:MFS family permease
MSSSYAVQGIAMVAAGVLTDMFGARSVWIAAGTIYIVGAFVAFLMTRWLPVTHAEEQAAIETSSESALAALVRADSIEPVVAAPRAATSGLERIAALLEEVEQRRALEGARRSTG